MGEFCWISIIFSQVVKFSLSLERSRKFGKNINMIIRNYASVSIGMLIVQRPWATAHRLSTVHSSLN